MRLDTYLTTQNLAPSRTRALNLIREGHVEINGKIIQKPAHEVSGADIIRLLAPPNPYVSRAAHKLLALLEAYPAGKAALQGATVVDVGASTGGFTQVCLENGAAHVYAVDVGHSQLHASLFRHPHVTNLEKTDARALSPALFCTPPTVLVCDVSFISQTKILPHIQKVIPQLHTLMILVKPQFEVGPQNVGKGGIVKSQEAQISALEGVKTCVENLGFTVQVSLPCPLKGTDGNQEYLLAATKS